MDFAEEQILLSSSSDVGLSTTWKLGAISISILRKQFDKTYVAVAFDNNGRAVTLNFIVVNGPDGWLIADVESPHDSLRMFLSHYRN